MLVRFATALPMVPADVIFVRILRWLSPRIGAEACTVDCSAGNTHVCDVCDCPFCPGCGSVICANCGGEICESCRCGPG